MIQDQSFYSPFDIAIIPVGGAFKCTVNSGSVHSCVKLDTKKPIGFDKDVSVKEFETLDISNSNNKIYLFIYYSVIDTFSVTVDSAEINISGDDYGESYEPGRKIIKLGEVDFSGDIPEVTQIIRSDIWIVWDENNDSSSSEDSSDSESESESDSDSDSDDSSSDSDDSSDIYDPPTDSSDDSNYDSSETSEDASDDSGTTGEGDDSSDISDAAQSDSDASNDPPP